MTPLRRASGLLLALAWAAASTGACAQVWGFVDDRGVAHFAPEQVDERYELFHSGEAQARSLSYFEVSPHYKAVRHILRDAAHQHGLAPELLQAMVAAESGFDAKAVSPRGAVGLMQITPIAAQEVGLKVPVGRAVEDLLIDPHINLHTGAKVLARLFTLFPDRLDLIVAAYNAGEGAVRRAGTQVPDIPETRQYVQTVLRLYRDLLPPKAVQQARLRDRHTPFRQP